MNGEKPVFGIDWDDGPYEFQLNYLPYYNRRHGTSFTPADISSHDLSVVFGQDNEYIAETIHDFHQHEESVGHGIRPDAVEVIPVLAQTFQNVIITARKKRFEHRIYDMVEAYLPGSIAAIYHLEDYERFGSKGAFLRALGAVALADDYEGNIYSAIEHGVRGLLWNMPKNYYLPLAVERVNGWYDIYEKLTGQPFSPSSPPSGTDGPAANRAWSGDNATPIRPIRPYS